MKRIFHPIGQGAFYSERHAGFNIVYDCGNWRNSNLATQVVETSFSKGEVIDILFISHFDYDHVNKINVLVKNFKIKKVVMPLLHDEEKSLLTNIYRVLNYHVLNLINKPERYFGDGTRIIRVYPSNEYDKRMDGDEEIEGDEDSLNIEDLKTRDIKSGTVLKTSSVKCDWQFIPYNYENNQRRINLENALLSSGFSESYIRRLKSDPKFTLEEITNDVGLSKKKGGRFFDSYIMI